MTARFANKAPLAIVAALASAGAMMIPASASAQSYNYVPGYGSPAYSQSYDSRYDDRCGRLGQGRTGAGVTIGAGLGAVAGSQLAARGRRTEGSILGGVLGAVIGGAVGRASNDNCQRSGYDYRYDQSGYAPAPAYADSYGYDRGYGQPVYDDRYADDRYRDDRYYDDRQGGYASSGYGYSQGYEQTCRSVQTTRRDNYGRLITQTRQVC